MGLSARAIDTALRISLCGDNTEQDIDELLTAWRTGWQSWPGCAENRQNTPARARILKRKTRGTT